MAIELHVNMQLETIVAQLRFRLADETLSTQRIRKKGNGKGAELDIMEIIRIDPSVLVAEEKLLR